MDAPTRRGDAWESLGREYGAVPQQDEAGCTGLSVYFKSDTVQRLSLFVREWSELAEVDL